jgi:hypothetical protein
MSDLFLGRRPEDRTDVRLDPDRLRTHGVVVGMTGSGKTGLCLVLLEELVLSGVPILAIDPKGDLGNLGLVFPQLDGASFGPWTGKADPAEVAERWKQGLAGFGKGPAELQALKDRMDLTVYTPGSEAGVPINALGSLRRPTDSVLADAETRRDLVSGTVSSLLALAGRKADPVRDPVHIVLSRILDDAWGSGQDLDLEGLILQLVDPPFEKVGVFPLDRFLPPDDRMDVAMTLNGLIASQAFAPWTQGVDLDLDAMLTPAARTPVHVFSLAHLDDTQRSFFVALLASRLLAWSRTQPGTEDLRALLFFDEAVGYLPPHPYDPPTKRPLITLLKQSRAVGLGIVLSTQNPVDLDYKALSNTGVWCIGRLQTPQDRQRLLKGLSATHLDGVVEGLDKRQFLLHQVGRGEPQVFGTRWAQCYLRGPFTRREVTQLNADLGVVAPVASTPGAGAATTRTAPASVDDGLLSASPAPVGTSEWTLDPRVAQSARLADAFSGWTEPRRDDGAVVLRPALYAELRLRFDEERAGFVLDHRERRVWFPIDEGLGGEPLAAKLEADDLQRGFPEGARFHPLPDALDEAKELKRLQKQVVDDVYRSDTRGLFTNPKLRLWSKGGESRGDFDARCSAAIEDRLDAGIGKLKDKIETRVDRLDARIRAKEQKRGGLESQAKARQLQEAVYIGETVLSWFGGRKKSLNSAMSKRRMTSNAQDRVEALDLEIQQLQDDAVQLRNDLLDEVQELRDTEEALLDFTEERQVRLEKNDIQVVQFGVLWVPVTPRI